MAKKTFNIENPAISPAMQFISTAQAENKELVSKEEAKAQEKLDAINATSFRSGADHEEGESNLEENAKRITRTLHLKGYKANALYVETKTKRIQLLVQPSLAEEFREAARKHGLSFNEAACRALEQYLDLLNADITAEKGQ